MNFQECMVLDSIKVYHQIPVREEESQCSKIIGTELHHMKNIGRLMVNSMFRQTQILASATLCLMSNLTFKMQRD